MGTESKAAGGKLTRLGDPQLGWSEAARLFRVFMWVPLLFLPLPVPGLGTPPDFVGWFIALGGLASIRDPRAQTLRHIAQVGLILSAVRVGLVVNGAPSWVHMAFFVVGSVAATALMIAAGGLAAKMARAADEAPFAKRAAFCRWIFALHPAVLPAAALLFHLRGGGLSGLLLAYVPFFLAACLVYTVMRIMERASRLCRAQQMTAAGDA